MSSTPDGPRDQPEGEAAHALAEKMLSEPMIVVIALGIFLVCVVVLEAPAIWDALVALWPK